MKTISLLGCGLFLAAGSAGLHSAAPDRRECKSVQLPDGSSSRYCKGANGKWVLATANDAPPAPPPIPLEIRADAEYSGTFSQTLTQPSRGRVNTRDILGSMLNQALNTRSQTVQGAVRIVAKLDGASSSAVISGTGLQTLTFSGSVQGTRCELYGSGGRTTSIRYSGSCTPQGFSGTVSGTTSNGATISGRFDTTAVKYLDIGMRDQHRNSLKAACDAGRASACVELDQAH